ncbi:hypothetical protein [Demequina rhizosphaerae]|uniref:hypothetical protein n=1 Tax=Demequina rhizosphaerae TaxID=1638985 RepID=UPI0007818F30|nr:hypothetical protein [Demequina rhizosphaerae]
MADTHTAQSHTRIRIMVGLAAAAIIAAIVWIAIVASSGSDTPSTLTGDVENIPSLTFDDNLSPMSGK